MLFETQEEADRFIAYNRGDILKGRRKAPVRSYYCEICGGWHVTSNPSKEDAKRLDVKDKALAEEVDRRVKAKLEPKTTEVIIPRKFDILKNLEQSDIMMTEGKLNEAENLLEKCRYKLQADEQRKKITNPDNFFRGTILLEKLSEKLEKLKEVVSSSYDEQETFINKEGKTEDEEEVCVALVSIKAIDRIKRAFYDIDEAIKNREFSILKYYVAQCQKQIGSIHGPGRGEIARHWNEELIKAMLRAKEVRKGNCI
jgi:hypothetical protein